MLYPLPAVMVSVADKDGKPNIFTVAWTGTVLSLIHILAQLLKKELEERDRLCVGFMKLQQFTQESLRTNGIAAKQSAKVSRAEPVDACGTEIRSVSVGTNPTALVETEKMGWLFQKFRNPERPAYIHEKGRISSEWLEQLHQICLLYTSADPLYVELIPDEEVRKRLMPELFQCDLTEFYETCEIFADSKELNGILVVSDETEPYHLLHRYFTEVQATLRTEGYLIRDCLLYTSRCV